MPDVDLVSRYIGGAALVVSAGSAVVSALSYRQVGPRVKAVLVTRVDQERDQDPVVYATIRLVNAGQSPVQVVGFGFRLDHSVALDNLEARSWIGPELPLKLEGLHTEEWSATSDDVKGMIAQLGREPHRIQAVVTLGSGRKVKTPSTKLRPWLSALEHPPRPDRDIKGLVRTYTRDKSGTEIANGSQQASESQAAGRQE